MGGPTFERDRDAWWIEHALKCFRFLTEECVYELAEVRQHFRGDHIRWHGPVVDVVLGYAAEEGILHADLWPSGSNMTATISISELLGTIEPSVDWSAPTTVEPLGRDVVEVILTRWALGMKVHLRHILCDPAMTWEGIKRNTQAT